MNLKLKKRLTIALAAILLATGLTYQYLYQRRDAQYRKAITGYFYEYFNRAPEKTELNYWTDEAVDHWGLEKVKQVAFIEGAAARKK